jgi:hypothetical protein
MRLPTAPKRDNAQTTGDPASVVGQMTGTRWRRTRIPMAAAALVAAAAVVGSGLGAEPAGTSASSPRPELMATTVPPKTEVLAPPMGFPNLDALTDVSKHHEMDTRSYPETAFQTPTGSACRMVTTRGGTSVECFGPVPGLDQPANHAFADEEHVGFQHTDQPSDPYLRDAKPLDSGQKIVFGPDGDMYGGDQITCGVQDSVVACILVKQYAQNHGDQTSTRTGFVLGPEGSWTFQLPKSSGRLDVPAETLTRNPPKR